MYLEKCLAEKGSYISTWETQSRYINLVQDEIFMLAQVPEKKSVNYHKEFLITSAIIPSI